MNKLSNGRERMNVLWLVDHLGNDGFMHGAGKYYLNTIPLFDKNKYNVILCVLRAEDNLTEQFVDEGIKVKHLGRSKLDPLTLLDIIKLVRDKSIELIHCHGYGSANFGRLTGLFCKIPAIVHAHDDDRNYPWHQEIADYLLSPFTDKAIAVSESVKESCINKRRINKKKLTVMHNGIMLHKFSNPENARVQKERARLGIGSDRRVIGTIAKLREEKGTRYLIESAPKIVDAFPDATFLVVGDGLLREELEILSRQLGVQSNVVFAGFCQDIPAILEILDIAVVPSLTEGSPLALIEAMAMGKPIVATNVGGIKEILEDRESGLLVPPKDPRALAEKIIHLLKNKDEAKRLGMRAKEESQKYDINFYVRTLEKNYLELVSLSKNN